MHGVLHERLKVGQLIGAGEQEELAEDSWGVLQGSDQGHGIEVLHERETDRVRLR